MTTPIILPCLHLNGTGPETLKEGYLAAYRATKKAREALTNVEFNARDYYPLGDDAWTRARAARDEQLADLDRIAADLMTILEHVQKVIDAKRRGT